MANMSYEEILDTKVIFGTAESVTEKLAQFKETLGLSAFTAELNPGGQLPKEAVYRSLKLLAEKVMPALK
jgi:alkanesulfonate monooxygenase SsuD/methylene tetrahydromethanopterin reductase-like flavin-dependent oxidoreductase (luciferase family)